MEAPPQLVKKSKKDVQAEEVEVTNKLSEATLEFCKETLKELFGKKHAVRIVRNSIDGLITLK